MPLKKKKLDRPFGDPDLQWGKPLHARPQVPVKVEVKVVESEGLLRGGQENQESFNDRGSGLRNPLTVPEEQAQRLNRLRNVAPLRVTTQVEVAPTLEENFRRQIAQEKKEQYHQSKILTKVLPTLEADPDPIKGLHFFKEIQSDQKWLHSVRNRHQQAEPTAAQLMLNLDENDVFGPTLNPAEWALWKIIFVFRFHPVEVAQLLDGVAFEDMKPSIPKIHKAGQPWSWCVAERFALVEAHGGREYLRALFLAARTLGLKTQEEIVKTFTGIQHRISQRAEWFAEFRYPTPPPEELNQKRELQRLALSSPGLEASMSPDEKVIIPVWIDCWWNGRECSRELEGRYSQSTVARVIRGFLMRLETLPRSKSVNAFLARTLDTSNCNGTTDGATDAEIMLALKSAPKNGEGWTDAFGGASIRNSYHHGQYTFERWGRTRWTDGGSTEKHRGQFWDSMDEESGA
ncbi:MAG TPA: hypothetical protein VOA88_10905 [Candidatus Dormibacteraeota bacterium]|nr:hypothetical protein [Candidatus Dormibacteraeota bacterium]